MSLLQKPFNTNYKRWRHIRLKYVVKILNIYHYRGEHGHYTTVAVQGSHRSPNTQVTWPATTFRKEFEPIGRKQKIKTALEIVLEDKGP